MILKLKRSFFLTSWACLLLACQGTRLGTPQIGMDTDPVIEIMAAEPSGDAAAYYYFSLAQMKLKAGEVAEAKWYLEKAMEFDNRSAAIRMELAGLLLMNNDEEGALALIQQVLADEPENSDALTMAGRIYQQKKMYTEAKTYFERALALNPNDPNLYIHLGRIYWNEQNLANAERIFRMMAKTFPASYAAHFFSGKVLADQGKYEEAIGAFNRSLELEPSLEETRFELVDIYRKRNMGAQIVATYEEILAYNPENTRASFELAVFYRETGKPQKGMPLLVDLGKRSQNENAILTYVYESYLEPKQYDTAAWLLEGMLRGAPNSSELHYLAGVTYDGLNRTSDALAHLTQVQPASRFYANAVIHRAVLLHGEGKADQAMDAIGQALSADPQNADYHLYLGSFYEEAERYDEAVEILERGLLIDPENAGMRFRLAVVYDKMGRRKEAIDLMEEVVLIEPNNAKALNYLGYTYAEMGIALDKAEELIMRAMKIKPDDGYITDSLAWVYFKQGRFEQALVWLKKAVTLVPDDPVILEHIGDVYQKLNQADAALKYYKRSLQLKPKDRESLKEKIRVLMQRP